MYARKIWKSRFRALFFTDFRNKWKIPMMLHERLNRKGKKSTFKFILIGNWWDEYTRYNNLNKEQFCTSSILVEVKWFKQIHYEKSVSALHSVVLCRRLEQGNCLKPHFFFLCVSPISPRLLFHNKRRESPLSSLLLKISVYLFCSQIRLECNGFFVAVDTFAFVFVCPWVWIGIVSSSSSSSS